MLVFPEQIRQLPEADLGIEGATGYLLQCADHQVIFWEFGKDVEVPPHSHEAQWGVVLEGTIALTIEGKENIYKKGDRYYVPKGAIHSAKIYAGYADITFFDQADRYMPK